ncbi:MAG: lysylphosphatidylglycerol synthase domain-containing protein [Aquaticitalea sp.]
MLIKLSIVVGAFYFIYHKLMTNTELEFKRFWMYLHQNDVFSTKNVLFLLLLTIFNWFFEVLKWKALVGSMISISFKNASEQSLGALTASLLTPNRIGEYGAKALYYQKPMRKKIMLLNLIGNMTQMTTTLFFGYVGFFFFALNYSLDSELVKLCLSILALTIILLAVFYYLKKIQFQIKGFSLDKIQSFIKGISTDIKLKASIFSVIRYLIFSFQFYHLLQIFGVDLNYLEAMTVISTMYLLSSIIPSIFIFDVIVKGSVAVYLFSMVGVNDLTVLCIVTLMWLLNFVVPSVFGSYYVLNFNLPKVENSL